MSDFLDTFLQYIPDWAEVIDKSDLPISVVVRTEVIGSKIGKIDLLLKEGKLEPSVEELNTKSKQLPDFCLERHIMSDRTFCLGHIEGDNGLNEIEAFWYKLKSHLDNQDYAARLEVWPIEQGMSHSSTSMEAQKLIEDLISSDETLLQEWLLAAFRGKGWISKAAHKGSTKSRPKYTARQACPRGCSTLSSNKPGCQIGNGSGKTRHTKQDRQMLCGDCNNPHLINHLLMLENIRWSADRLLHKLLESQAKPSSICCGTMKTCPLNTGV